MLYIARSRLAPALRRRPLPQQHIASALNFCTGPVDARRERDAKPSPPLKGLVQSTALGSALLALPKGTVFAAAATPAPLCGPAMVTFLQTFPPIAAQFCFLAPWTSMKQVEKVGDVGDLPLLPYAAMAVNGVGWMCYGWLAPGEYGEPTIWVPNITAALFGSYYWSIYAKNTTASMAPWYGGGAIAVGGILGLAASSDTIGGYEPRFILGLYLNAVVVAMFGGPLSALGNVIKTKNTASIPFPFAIATFANCLSWSMYGYMVVHDPLVYTCNLLGLGSAVAQLGCHAVYGIHSTTADEASEPEANVKEEEKK